MKLLKLFYAGVVLTLALVANSKGEEEEDYKEVFLRTHNEYRAKHNAPPMKLSDTLTTEAQKCAEHYASIKAIDHSCSTPGTGENLWATIMAEGALKMGMGFKQEPKHVMAEESVTAWYLESKYYNYDDPGTTTPPKKVVGHFTQLVWLESTELGVGIDRETEFGAVVGKYSPPGNMRSFGDPFEQYKKSVLRPVEGKQGSSNSDSSDSESQESKSSPAVQDPLINTMINALFSMVFFKTWLN